MEAKRELISMEQMRTVYPSQICTVKEYKDYHRKSAYSVVSPAPNILTIEHGREGRVEFRMGHESAFLTAGDVVLRRTDGAARNIADIAAEFGYANASKFSTASGSWGKRLPSAGRKVDKHRPPESRRAFCGSNCSLAIRFDFGM